MPSLRTVFFAISTVLCSLGNLPTALAADEARSICLNLVETHCGGSAPAEVMDACVTSGILSCARPEFCSQPSETGMCRAAMPRFYFSSESGACEQFIYGGCQGNTNNFLSAEACEDACQGLRYCGDNSGASCPSTFGCDNGLCVPSKSAR